MISFNQETGALVSTDLGRIAAKYYIRAKTVVIFIERMRPKMSEADVFDLVCKSTEVRLLFEMEGLFFLLTNISVEYSSTKYNCAKMK